MNTRFSIAILFAALAIQLNVQADPPPIISYQGKVAVGNVNFTGTGQFKFALVNGSGNTTYWSNDGTSIAGSQPTAAVSLNVASGLFTLLLGDTSLANMTAIPASVFANSDVRVRVWFNDGTHGFQLLSPDERVASNGYAFMASTVPNGSITSAQLANGAVGSAQIATGAVSVDKLANGVALPSGSIVSSTSSADPALQAAGFQPFGGPNLTGESWTIRSSTAPLQSFTLVQSVWTGSALLCFGGNTPTNKANANQGAKWSRTTGTWTPLSTINAPSARTYHTATWTGTEMIVWGGEYNSIYRADGARYNPATDTWTPMSTLNAPSQRSHHSAVWTGARLIIWGGSNSIANHSGSGTMTDLGSIYDPASDTWTPVSQTNAPTQRFNQAAIWTGSKMIVWGGYHYGSSFGSQNNGGVYDPLSYTWTTVTSSGSPTPRYGHAQIWTGAEMLVWGGYNDGSHTVLGSGGGYNPSTNTWRSLSANTEPTPRAFMSYTWSGSELVVWGGSDSGGGVFTSGGVYSNTTDSWTSISGTPAPPAENYVTTAFSVPWDGREMLLLGTDGIIYSCAPRRTFYFYQKQ